MRDLIHEIARDIGIRAPKISEYANCTAVAFRNAEGHRVLITLPTDASQSVIRDKLIVGLRTKAEAGAMTTEAMLQRISPGA